jgi:transposase
VNTRADYNKETLIQFSHEKLTDLVLQLQDVNTHQAEFLALLVQQVEELKQEILRLKGQKPGPSGKIPPEPPDWAKANSPSTEKPKRKKRAQNFTRPREEPTEEVVHACDTCPDCGRTLSGGTQYSRRQIIELPPITVRIIDHIVQARYCGVCQRRQVPSVDLSEQAVGQSRFGQGVHALVAYLRQVGRLPIRTIAAVLSALCNLKISMGEVTRMLAAVAQLGKSAYADLQKQLKKSDYVHGDETGWREDGQNGYLWSFSTPSVCFFTYPKTRAGHVVTDVLGSDYPGILSSDFYAAYNVHMGLHQRCWSHLLRDVRELKRKFPIPSLVEWAEKLHKLYHRACAFSSEDPKKRAAARVEFQKELVALATPYAVENLPQSTLCKRMLQFESELFTFVEYPQVPPDNNAAERSIRPRVIARKISGGTRSSAGSKTMEVLSSLFATWQLRGQECLKACREMLADAQKPKASQPA